MFETSRPRYTARKRLFFLELLPLSLGFHGAIVAAVVLTSIWNVSFPNQSPKYYAAFRLEDAPPPPPPPPPPPAARPQPVMKPQVRPPDEIVAPSIIPDAIPIVENEQPPEIPEAVEGGVEGGVAGGEIGGSVGGVIGGIIADQPKPAPPVHPDDGRVYIERDQPLELPILAQAYPIYPSSAASKGWEDQLVVRYIIGKDGRVKDVVILEPPEKKDFEQPTLRAIRLWRFRPYVKNGERVEVVHELTVHYRLVQQGG